MDAKEFRQRVSILEKGGNPLAGLSGPIGKDWAGWRSAADDALYRGTPGSGCVGTQPGTAWKASPGAFRKHLSRYHFQHAFCRIGQLRGPLGKFYPMLWMVALGVRRANPEAAFRAGERPEIYWPVMLFAFGALGLLATVLFSLPVSFGSVTATPLLKGVFVLITLPVLLGWAWKSRLRAFNPDTDLEELVTIKGCAA